MSDIPDQTWKSAQRTTVRHVAVYAEDNRTKRRRVLDWLRRRKPPQRLIAYKKVD